MIDQEILKKAQGFDDKKALIQGFIIPLAGRSIFAARPELNRFSIKTAIINKSMLGTILTSICQ
jgi:hypothetical protein